MTTKQEGIEAARALAAKYNKAYSTANVKGLGSGALVLASEMITPRKFTSGSLSLDVSLNGGWAGNQWSEVYGPENSGKTTITLKTLAANQAADPDFFTLWVASEHYDLELAKSLGVDTDRVYVLSTRDMAVGYGVIIDYLDQRAVDMVVLDSYPAMIPPDEDSKDMDEYTQAEGAKMTNKFFRKVGKAGLRNALDEDDRPWFGLFINQPREKIGAKSGIPGYVPETTPGGRGKNFAFFARLNVKRLEWIEEGPKSATTKVGQVIRTTAVKNKGGPPARVASMDYYFADSEEEGFRRGEYDIAKDVVTVAVLSGVIHKGGGWYKFQDRQWQGLQNVLASLREEPDLLADVDKEARAAAADPEMAKRKITEADIESASTGQTKIRRNRGRD